MEQLERIESNDNDNDNDNDIDNDNDNRGRCSITKWRTHQVT